jgi:hypothetical protein
LNPAALEALKQCEQLNMFGLKVTTETAPNDERIAISFLLSVVPGTTGRIVVEAPQTEADVTCTGPIPSISEKLLPPNQNVTYVCSRKVETRPFEYRGQRLYAKASMITIPTSSGAISRNMPTIYADRLPPSELENKLKALTLAATPVGTVISSFLTFDEMKKIDPDFQNYWQPADGRLVNRATAYFKAKTDQSLNPVKLPDLRGVFLRGLNAFDSAVGIPPATAAQLDPETRSLGHFQADDFKSHTHPITNNSPAFAYRVSGMGIQSNRGQEVQFAPPAISIGAAGGNETRPKNVAVYYFIRVN